LILRFSIQFFFMDRTFMDVFLHRNARRLPTAMVIGVASVFGFAPPTDARQAFAFSKQIIIKKRLPESSGPGQVELEAATKRDILRDEDALQELRETCTELDRVASEFVSRLGKNAQFAPPQLSDQDHAQLKRMEKLARKIRSSQGGRGDEDEIEIPLGFADRVKLLDQTSEELKRKADKATRHTVSFAIISRSLRVLRLVKALNGKS
jgi:hypothetical protein